MSTTHLFGTFWNMPLRPDPLVTSFHDDAAAFCAFIDELRLALATQPYTNLLRLLSNLAKSGAAIPFDMTENEHEDAERIDHERWKTIASEIAVATAPACEALIAHHATDEESLVRASMLWDDLADLYRDLRHGLDLHAKGKRDDIADAVWLWRFGYEHHWGQHLFRALMTVHEIRYQLYFE